MEGKAGGGDGTTSSKNKTTRDKSEIELFDVEEGPLLLDAIHRGLRRLRDQLPDHLKFDIVNEAMTVDELHEAMNGKNAGVGGDVEVDTTGNRRPPASPPYQKGDTQDYDYYDYYYYDYYSEDSKGGDKNKTVNRRGGTSKNTNETHPSNPPSTVTNSSSGDYYYNYDDDYYSNYHPGENGNRGKEITTLTTTASTTPEPLPTPCWNKDEASLLP